MTEQERTELDYVKRMLEGTMLYITLNEVRVTPRLRNNIQNAIHSLVEQLAKPTEDGTSGQDRESYSDDQDRDSYSVE